MDNYAKLAKRLVANPFCSNEEIEALVLASEILGDNDTETAMARVEVLQAVIDRKSKNG